MTQDGQRRTRQPLLVNLAWAAALALLLALAYVASYPVALRFVRANTVVEGVDMIAYRPVQYLIDETPLAGPIYWWCGICGVEYEAAYCSDCREAIRSQRPDPLPKY